MKKTLSTLVILATAFSANAANVSDYVSHIRLQGSSATQGKWDIDYVQLRSFGQPLSKNDFKINSILKKATSDICLPSDDATEAQYSESNESTKVTFVSSRLLAVSIGYDASCAGSAHPSNGVASTIYDRAIGQAIDISTGLAITDKIYTTASPAFNKLVLKEMIQQAAKEKAQRGSSDCDDQYEASNMQFYFDGISLSSKAISVDLSTAHVDQACGFTTVIPLEKFLAVAKKGSVLEELAKAAGKK